MIIPKYINWLASYPKSGSTWVRAFLEHYITGELDINNMGVVFSDERICYYQAVSALPHHDFDLYHWALVRPAALMMYMHLSPGKKQLILKTHNAWATIGEVPLFPPLVTGPSVYLVRNPMDVVPSFAKHTGSSIEDMLSAMQNNSHSFSANAEKHSMIGFLSSWSNHVKAWSSADQSLVVRYEDLKDNPYYWFVEILKQYGIEVQKDRVYAAIEAASLKNLQAQEAQSGFSEAGRNDVFFGGPREMLTPTQIDSIIDSFGPVMADHGYLEVEEVRYGSGN